MLNLSLSLSIYMREIDSKKDLLLFQGLQNVAVPGRCSYHPAITPLLDADDCSQPRDQRHLQHPLIMTKLTSKAGLHKGPGIVDQKTRTSVSARIWGEVLRRATLGRIIRPQHITLKRCGAI